MRKARAWRSRMADHSVAKQMNRALGDLMHEFSETAAISCAKKYPDGQAFPFRRSPKVKRCMACQGNTHRTLSAADEPLLLTRPVPKSTAQTVGAPPSTVKDTNCPDGVPGKALLSIMGGADSE
jgi:hypothetical protein